MRKKIVRGGFIFQFKQSPPLTQKHYLKKIKNKIGKVKDEFILNVLSRNYLIQFSKEKFNILYYLLDPI